MNFKGAKKTTLALLAFALLALTGCAGDTFRDLEGVKGQDPSKVEIIYNVDGFPNIVRICVDKVAFATTTREAQAAIFRVPEWDVPFCGATPK
jgi:hypothetical protein